MRSLYLTSFKHCMDDGRQAFRDSARKALVLVPGSSVGAALGFGTLDVLRRGGYELLVVPSQDAIDVLGKDNIASLAGLTGTQLDMGRCGPDIVKHVDLVYLPVVSPSLVARVGHGIYDEPLASLVFHALMAGVPVIGTEDGARPTSDGYRAKGYSNPSPGLVEMLEANLGAVAALGMRLYPSRSVAKELGRVINIPSAVPAGKPSVLNTKVITRSDLVGLENCTVLVPTGARFTELAKEYAAEKGVKFSCNQEGEVC
ncbi:MAG: hypothetical protein HPY55_09440 [Firmicutes bacterium]|nr:hypothetical protein [Bacillota bacterium]